MDTAIVQKRVNDLAAAMVAKGMREPSVSADLRSDSSPQVYMAWQSGIGEKWSDGHKSKFIYGDFSKSLDEAMVFIASQPDAEEAKMRDFMTALGKVIDLGNQHGIQAEYLNPIVASMRKLSENIITDARAA